MLKWSDNLWRQAKRSCTLLFWLLVVRTKQSGIDIFRIWTFYNVPMLQEPGYNPPHCTHIRLIEARKYLFWPGYLWYPKLKTKRKLNVSFIAKTIMHIQIWLKLKISKCFAFLFWKLIVTNKVYRNVTCRILTPHCLMLHFLTS